MTAGAMSWTRRGATARNRFGARPGKRVFDAALAVLLLCVLAPLLLVVMLLVRLTTPGHAVFRQTRIGRHGRPFIMYKFRTMRVDATDEIHRAYVVRLLTEDNPPVGGARGLYKVEADPRITRVGHFLRRTSIDELPQLVNVIRGQMSLVGPRPALPWEAELFPAHYAARFLVRPGVTGLWQVSGRNRLSMRAGLDLDLHYVHRQSFKVDVTILVKTVLAVFKADAS
ncbi:MAG: sugar transferase [Actinomycetota bacterium]|nr:sugar transferase [Actinomycetota bacterium]